MTHYWFVWFGASICVDGPVKYVHSKDTAVSHLTTDLLASLIFLSYGSHNFMYFIWSSSDVPEINLCIMLFTDGSSCSWRSDFYCFRWKKIMHFYSFTAFFTYFKSYLYSI